ncbi:MAG: hypothetical protein KDK39_00475 [Leptospiraceae bacterium]|nr:hypothetical protein [Leptospiraceae bacterium]
MMLSLRSPISWITSIRVVIHWTILALAIFRCTQTPTESLTEIQTWIQEGKIEQARQRIAELLTTSNQEFSETLIARAKPVDLQVSLNGDLAAWSQGSQFHFHDASLWQQMDLDKKIASFQLSFSGKYAAVLVQNKDQLCDLELIDTTSNSRIQHNIGMLPCQNQPVISDDGQILYFIKDNNIHFHQIAGNATQLDLDGQIAHEAEPTVITQNQFSRKYKKLQYNIYLYQINQRGWLAFYGTGGYYQLYFYPGSGNKLIPEKTTFAKPALFTIFDGSTLTEVEPLATDKEPNNAPDPVDTKKPSRAKDSYLFASALAFAYSGGAGQRQLLALKFTDDIKRGTAMRSPVWPKLQFIRDREEFMILKNNELFYWNPLTQKKVLLPVIAHDFVLFAGGLLYRDINQNLNLRKKAFTPFEIQLVQIREGLPKESKDSQRLNE